MLGLSSGTGLHRHLRHAIKGEETGPRLVFRPNTPLCPSKRMCASSWLARCAEVVWPRCRSAAFTVAFSTRTLNDDRPAIEVDHCRSMSIRERGKGSFSAAEIEVTGWVFWASLGGEIMLQH